MKFSYNWICEYVEGLDTPAAELAHLITMKTAECEGVEPAGAETVIEIDNKSINHRPDLWGHLGLAREVAAITRKRLLDPVDPNTLPLGPPLINVQIDDFDLCPRYNALVFGNVVVQQSPPWLRSRLTAIGLNPINSIVDMTNYVMAALAQPMHAFDRDLLSGDTIRIRPARAGEEIRALNGIDYTLKPANLVVADERGPVAIAGVIGGFDSAITARTTTIVLESATFHAASVRRTSDDLKLRTDASMRFEKAQDPENTVRGLAMAMDLLKELSPGAGVKGSLAEHRKPFTRPRTIDLRLDWLNSKLGRNVSAEEVRDILERLAFEVSEDSPRVFTVRPPTWRATKDIAVKDDLLEEVGRMIGYDSIHPQPPLVLDTPPPADPARLFQRAIRAQMTAQGFTEVHNYSFNSEEQVRVFGFDPRDHARVANPVASDQPLMRISLLPGIYRNVLDNSRHFDAFRLFEIGREIHPRSEGLPDEVPHLAAAIYGKNGGAAGLFELKRAAECLMEGAEIRPVSARSFEHPARTGEVIWQGAVAGRLFELHPSLLEEGRAAMLDLNLRLMLEVRPLRREYQAIRRFPSSHFDLSVIAGGRELIGVLKEKLIGFAGPMLEQIEFLRQYAGPPLPEGARSVSFRLTVGAVDRTLSSADVSEIRAAIIERMRGLGYELRV